MYGEYSESESLSGSPKKSMPAIQPATPTKLSLTHPATTSEEKTEAKAPDAEPPTQAELDALAEQVQAQAKAAKFAKQESDHYSEYRRRKAAQRYRPYSSRYSQPFKDVLADRRDYYRRLTGWDTDTYNILYGQTFKFQTPPEKRGNIIL